jgi:hypothetical protein
VQLLRLFAILNLSIFISAITLDDFSGTFVENILRKTGGIYDEENL